MVRHALIIALCVSIFYSWLYTGNTGSKGRQSPSVCQAEKEIIMLEALSKKLHKSRKGLDGLSEEVRMVPRQIFSTGESSKDAYSRLVRQYGIDVRSDSSKDTLMQAVKNCGTILLYVLINESMSAGWEQNAYKRKKLEDLFNNTRLDDLSDEGLREEISDLKALVTTEFERIEKKEKLLKKIWAYSGQRW